MLFTEEEVEALDDEELREGLRKILANKKAHEEKMKSTSLSDRPPLDFAKAMEEFVEEFEKRLKAERDLIGMDQWKQWEDEYAAYKKEVDDWYASCMREDSDLSDSGEADEDTTPKIDRKTLAPSPPTQAGRDRERAAAASPGMASMKLGSNPDVFKRQGQASFCSTGLPSDVTVEVGDMSFHLHKFALLSKSALLEQLIEESSDGEECIIKLNDIPGGAKSFELVARFCYGVKLELSSANIGYLRCASEHLQMTEEVAEDNLIAQSEMFLYQNVLRNWKDSLTTLKTCDDLLPHAEHLQIVKRCIESLASKATTDLNLFGWPIREHGIMQSPGGSVLWNGISMDARPRNFNADWWYDDASSLSFPMYKRLITTMESRGIRPEIIAGSLTYYAKKYLPGLGRRHSTGADPLTATLSEVEQKNLLEEIDALLPVQKGLASTKVLHGILCTALIIKASSTCISNLEKRIGMQLDQATLEDLLVPNFSYTMETMYSVDCVHRILEHFLVMDQANGGASSYMDDVMASPSLTPITNVAKLIDDYLAEIALDINLKLSKFTSLASAVPKYARPLDDGLYRAIDIYLKEHSWLSEAEKEQLCHLMDCQKLSLEACTHAAQNDRLPLRVVVQVLFFEQLQLRTSIDGCLLVSNNLEGSSSEAGEWATAVRENQVLKVDMDNMRMRLAELEKAHAELEKAHAELEIECSSMKQEIEKSGRGKSGLASRAPKRFSLKRKSLMCSTEEGSVSEQQKSMSSKLDKMQAKVSKQKKQLPANS